jgi:hypothetical protein
MKSKSKKAKEILDYDSTDTTSMIDKRTSLSFEDLNLELPPTPPTQVVSIRLPTELLNEIKASVVAGGYAGNGQKVYVRFNSGATTCAYQSYANTTYKSLYCAKGVTESPGVAGTGLTGGVAVIWCRELFPACR